MDLNKRKKTAVWMVGGILILLTAAYSLFLLDGAHVVRIAREDGPIEYGTALFLLGASIFFLCAFLAEYRLKRNVFLLLLAILFFFGFGEEISWGQRIFHWQTPESIRAINVQDEFNIHNLEIFNRLNTSQNVKHGWALMLNIERIFSIFWLSFCVIMPVLNRLSSHVAGFLSRVGMPIVPLWIGVFFPVNYVISKFVERNMVGDMRYLHLPVMEVKEFCFAALFLLIAIHFVKSGVKR